MFRSILVPIDLAQPSSWQPVLPEAIAMARQNAAGLTVMTVVRDTASFFESRFLAFQIETAMAEARRALAAVVHPFAAPDLPIRQIVRFGSIGGEILAEAQDCGADLIVMASHRPEMKDYLIGPNAAHVARHAACSVLVLRPKVQPAAG
jgi:nucleotide-binding universal stress UspA family protein